MILRTRESECRGFRTDALPESTVESIDFASNTQGLDRRWPWAGSEKAKIKGSRVRIRNIHQHQQHMARGSTTLDTSLTPSFFACDALLAFHVSPNQSNPIQSNPTYNPHRIMARRAQQGGGGAPPPAAAVLQCQVCQEQPSKYKCPGCALRYCSVACCKAHKAAPCPGSTGTGAGAGASTAPPQSAAGRKRGREVRRVSIRN